MVEFQGERYDAQRMEPCRLVDPMLAAVGSLCGACGHTTLVHFGVEECPVCVLEIAASKVRAGRG